MNRLKKMGKFLFADVFEKFFAAWLFAGAVLMPSFSGIINLSSIDITGTIVIFTLFYICISVVSQKLKGIVYAALPLSVLIFSCTLLYYNQSIYTFIILALFLVLSVHHYITKRVPVKISLSTKHTIIIVTVFALFFFGSVTLLSVFRYLTYTAPNFDFGIFCNMYHNMRESLKPLVSCERDKILSHFAVHFSPALYVFLPVYFIFPSPVTVAVCQTLAIYSGIIPFILIMKHRGLSQKTICLLSVMFLANAAFSAGCLFDFHENCLLVPFLMWMFYFYEKKKLPLMLLFTVLTLMVKEDAFIYVCVFAAYIFIADKKYRLGSGLVVLATAYFLVACWYINNHGMGIMSDRFDAMIDGDDGLLGMVKTVIFNPAYSVRQILLTGENDGEKLFYVVQIFAPLAFIPFFTKKKIRLMLVLPMLLNLFTSYQYQYNISFQYSFGITTLLMYLSVLNVQDMKPKMKNMLCVSAAGIATMLFFMLIVPNTVNDMKSYSEKNDMYTEMNEVLDTIPDDASVAASTFLIPHLWDREVLYEAYYTTHDDFEYLVLDVRGGYKEDSMRLAAEFEEKGYEPYDLSSEYIYIYKKAE